MCKFVSFQATSQSEGLVTCGASMGSFSSVDTLVTPQASGVREGIAALSAGVRFLTRVG